METIKHILMKRDGMSSWDADDLIDQARVDLQERLEAGEMPFDICQEWLNLEPDYIMELL